MEQPAKILTLFYYNFHNLSSGMRVKMVSTLTFWNKPLQLLQQERNSILFLIICNMSIFNFSVIIVQLILNLFLENCFKVFFQKVGWYTSETFIKTYFLNYKTTCSKFNSLTKPQKFKKVLHDVKYLRKWFCKNSCVGMDLKYVK